jgi:hypothetical protein
MSCVVAGGGSTVRGCAGPAPAGGGTRRAEPGSGPAPWRPRPAAVAGGGRSGSPRPPGCAALGRMLMGRHSHARMTIPGRRAVRRYRRHMTAVEHALPGEPEAITVPVARYRAARRHHVARPTARAVPATHLPLDSSRRIRAPCRVEPETPSCAVGGIRGEQVDDVQCASARLRELSHADRRKQTSSTLLRRRAWLH